MVIGNMIGVGVFTTSGFSLRDLGTPSMVVTAWAVGGLVAIAGAVSYGQLVRHMPESGGEYLFLSRAAHPFFGCIAGWVSVVAGFTGPIALSATLFEEYALPSSIRPSWFREDMLACVIIALCFAWHAALPKLGEFGQNFVVALKLLMLMVFLVFATCFVSPEKWQGTNNDFVETRSQWQLLLAFAGSLVWISFSFAGFNAAVYVADEVDDARTISRALVAATTTVVLLYTLLNAVFVFAPPRGLVLDASNIKTIAAAAASWLGGNPLAFFVRTTIAIALFTSVSSMMLAGPRVYAKMASDGVMPHWMSFADGHPRTAIAVQAILAVVIVLNSKLAELLNYLSVTLALSAAGTVACLFAPSVRRNSLWHISSVAPFTFIVATLVSATLLAIDKPYELLGTAVTVLIGTAGYFAVRTSRR